MEIFDICDANGLPTGETVERERAHREGIRHRTAHVWIVDRRGAEPMVLLQKRSLCKDSFPGLYDTSSAGHIPSGSEPLPSALRELEEELGIRAEPEDLAVAGTFRLEYQETFHGKLFWDNEVTFVYAYEKPVEIEKLVFQPGEVDAAAWYPFRLVYEECRQGSDRFCPPMKGLETLRRYLGERA